MNIELFLQRAEALHKRVADLYETASVLHWIPSDLLPQAFKELYSTSKMVQLAAEELYQQNEELIQTRNLLEVERQYYQDLFELAPNAYLVTNSEGIIQIANQTAAKLLNISQQFLIGKPIISFILLEQHQYFYNELIQIQQLTTTREIFLTMKQHQGIFFDAALTGKAINNQLNKSLMLCWLIRTVAKDEREKFTAPQNQNEWLENRPIHKYAKGEVIPLNQLLIWYVHRGLVKLNTFCETGEEVLTGLVTAGMVFGSSMTSLPVYQATALTDVELVITYLAEIKNFPQLSQIFLPKIEQRLQQTEAFLVISSRRKVEERLHHLFELLKKQVGEKVPGGIRLTIRLTHEDIANACGTTRVTITRLIGKLQQEKIISFDDKKHIIFRI
ncbi:MAG TPA: helix-turn-helix domain-containing protein [Nostocaceae cyanobacterium]|nr:helix-turn-helix domain-containing protein [Nostocaceae cyanobacterium]